MFATEFIYDGISSKEYDLLMCSFDGARDGSFTAGSKIEFTTFKAPNSNKWVKTASTYNEQLTFDFQICKNPCVNEEPFTEREDAFIMRWLVRKDFKYLQFVQEGYENIYYNAQLNVEKYKIGGRCYGYTITVICDAPFGWSEPKSVTLSASKPTIELYDDSDEIGVIKPNMEIYVNTNGVIELSNTTTECNFRIDNCISGEVITVSEKKISSSECIAMEDVLGYEGNHLTFYDDYNYDQFTIGNTFEDRINSISLIGDCEVVLTWRSPRKAVV